MNQKNNYLYLKSCPESGVHYNLILVIRGIWVWILMPLILLTGAGHLDGQQHLASSFPQYLLVRKQVLRLLLPTGKKVSHFKPTTMNCKLTCILVIMINLSCNSNRNNQMPIPATILLGNGVEAQNFVINNEKDTLITLQSGSTLRIYPGTFTDGSGNIITYKINLIIYEYDSLNDCLLSGLSTVSDKTPLITDGMIYLSAKKDNAKLNIIKGIKVRYRSNIGRLENPKLFSGQINEDGINWTRDTSKVVSINLIQKRVNKDYSFYVYSNGTVTSNLDSYNYYDFSLSFTGWVNIDDYILPNSNIIVSIRNPEIFKHPSFCIIVPGISTIIHGFWEFDNENKEIYRFYNIPEIAKEKSIYIIGYSFDTSANCTYGIRMIKPQEVNDLLFEKSELKSVNSSEFAKIIRNLIDDNI